MVRARRWLPILGEGILAGLAAGGALGTWETVLQGHFGHRMYLLAVRSLFDPLILGAAAGAGASLALEILRSVLARRGNRWLRVGWSILAILFFVGAYQLAWRLRDRFFPLHVFTPKWLSAAIVAVVFGAAFLLLVARGWDRRRSGRAASERPFSTGRASVAAGGILAFVLFGGARLALPSLGSGRAAGHPSVILISIDTLRADRLGVLGNPRPITPHLDALAAEGVLFENAVSAAPWTLPSHVTIFTSLLPFDHRVRWDSQAIRPSLVTLAERFREAGYRTAAFTGGGYVSAGFGFAQGFEVYEDHDEVKEGGPGKIAASALAWARTVRSEPLFLFVHTYEPHSAYTNSQLADPRNAGRLSGQFTTAQVEAVHSRKLFLTPSEQNYVSKLYDGDVATADRVFGELLETLRREGILDRAVLVFLSDHGEDLWDHDAVRSPGHGHSLYEELVHVPLFVRGPGRFRSGVRIREPVSLLDVAPTILEVAGLPPDPHHQGRSLAETLRRGSEPAARPIQSESVEYGPNRYALREGSLKVILTPFPEETNSDVAIDVRPLEIFDLTADPAERHSLHSENPDRAAGMVQALWGRAEQAQKPGPDDGARRELPPELLEQLRSLGYLH